MEITPVTPVVRTTKVRTTKPAVSKSSSKAAQPAVAPPPAKPRKRKAVTKRPATSALPDLTAMIATTAYYLAERRQFAPGHELDDWLVAEQQVLGSISSS